METDETKTTTAAEVEGEPTEPAGEVATDTKTVAQDGAEKPQETKPASKPMFSEEELNQRIQSVKGGYDGTVKELKANIKKAQDEIRQAQEAREETELAQFLSKIESTGGDLDSAKMIVAQRKEITQKSRKLAELEVTLNERLAELNEAGRARKIDDLVREYALDASAKKDLEKATDPTMMENIALRLALVKKQETALPAKPTDSGLGGKGGKDLSKMSDSEILGWALTQVSHNK